MFKKLSQPSGSLSENKSLAEDSSEKLVRPAILVHAGDFMSGDGAIAFDEKRIKNLVENHNSKINALAESYGGLDKMPVGAFPPILDQHENDSNDRIIGRLASLLRFETRDVPGVGKNIPCACADITFLGEDSVKRVKDGRIYHLSIGIDESTDTLGETSAVIEPAAPGAMLLKKGVNMTNNKKRLESHKTRLSKLSSIQESLTKLSSKLDGASAKLTLTKAQGEVTSRLSALLKKGKLTPAALKEMDVKKLAAMPKDAIDLVLATLEKNPTFLGGEQVGSASAVPASDLRKNVEKRQLTNLKAEIKKDMRRMGAKVDDEEVEMNEEKKIEKKMAKDEHAVSGQAADEKQMKSKHLEELKKHLEGGDVEMAKSCLAAIEKEDEGKKEMSDGFAQENTEHVGKSMEELSGEVDEIKTQLARMAGLLGEMAKQEEEEGHDLETEMSEEESDEAKKKKLAEEIKKQKHGEQA